MIPKLDGTTLTKQLKGLRVDVWNDQAHANANRKVEIAADGTFTFEIEDDSLRLYYKTPFDTWKETVIKAKDSSLVILNRDGNTYFYKKFEKFNFN